MVTHNLKSAQTSADKAATSTKTAREYADTAQDTLNMIQYTARDAGESANRPESAAQTVMIKLSKDQLSRSEKAAAKSAADAKEHANNAADYLKTAKTENKQSRSSNSAQGTAF